MIFYGAIIFIFLALLDRVIILPAFSKMKAQDDDIREKKMIIKKDLHVMAIKDSIETESEKYKSYFSQTKATDDEEITAILKEISCPSTTRLDNSVKSITVPPIYFTSLSSLTRLQS